jgi:hypothetical protein
MNSAKFKRYEGPLTCSQLSLSWTIHTVLKSDFNIILPSTSRSWKSLIPWGFTIKLCALPSHASLTNITPVRYKSWTSSMCDFSYLQLIPLTTARYGQTSSLQGQLAHKGFSVASLQEISRKIKLNTLIKNRLGGSTQYILLKILLKSL